MAYLLNSCIARSEPMLSDIEPQSPHHKWWRKNGTKAHCFQTLPFQQFQVLFNSLFKVLCIFPSQYLYAIGLPPIFSLTWSLPRTLSCNPKQLDSLKICAMIAHSKQERECHPLCCSFPRDLARNVDRQYFSRPQLDYKNRFTRWTFPASVALTRGIIVIFFSSP